MNLKEEFINLYKENINREGSIKLLDWLETTDFYKAPASSKFHGACEGGLVMHSINVFKVMMQKHFEEGKDSAETFAIVSLLHDLCKTNFYKISKRNVKDELTGVWKQVPFYTIDDVFPYGHGEKSVFLIERFMRLKTHEAMAIRWHMGGFDESAKGAGFSISNAFDKCSLLVKLNISDIEATYLLEKGTSEVAR